jgi:hypothetical protein
LRLIATDWAQVSASWNYKQKAWRLRVEAHAHPTRRAERSASRELQIERRVELPTDPLESLREMAIMLCGAIKPRALAVASSWLKIDEWRASIAAASNFPALHELVTALKCALIGEDEPPARLQAEDEPPSAPVSIKGANGGVGTLLTRSPRRQQPHRATVKTEPSVKTELDIVKTEPDTVKTELKDYVKPEPIVKTEATVKTEAAHLSLEVERDYRVKLRARAQGRAQGRGSTDDQMDETPSHSDDALTGAALNWARQQLSVGQCVRARFRATTLGPANAFWFSGTIRYVMKLTSDDL